MATRKETTLCPVTGLMVNGDGNPVQSFKTYSKVAHVTPVSVVQDEHESSDVEMEYFICEEEEEEEILRGNSVNGKSIELTNNTNDRKVQSPTKIISQPPVLNREPQVIVRTFDFPKLTTHNIQKGMFAKNFDLPKTLNMNQAPNGSLRKPKERWKYQHDIVSPPLHDIIMPKPVLISLPKNSNLGPPPNNNILPKNHAAVASMFSSSNPVGLPLTGAPPSSLASKALQSMALASNEIKLARISSEMKSVKTSAELKPASTPNLGFAGGKYVILKPAPSAEKGSEEDTATSNKLRNIFTLKQTQYSNKNPRTNTIILQSSQQGLIPDSEFRSGRMVINPFHCKESKVSKHNLSTYDTDTSDKVDKTGETQSDQQKEEIIAAMRNNLLGAPLIKAPVSSSLDESNTIHLEILSRDVTKVLNPNTESRDTLNSQLRSDNDQVDPHVEQHGPVIMDCKADIATGRPAVGDKVRLISDSSKPVLLKHELSKPVLLVRSSCGKPILVREHEMNNGTNKDQMGNSIVIGPLKGKPVVVRQDESKPVSMKLEMNDIGVLHDSIRVAKACDIPRLVKVNGEHSRFRKVDSDTSHLLKVDHDSPRMIKVDSDNPRLIKVERDSPRLMKVDPDSPRLLKVDRDSPRLLKVDRDSPRLMKVDRDTPRLYKVDRETSRVLKVDLDAPRLMQVDGNTSHTVKMHEDFPHLLRVSPEASLAYASRLTRALHRTEMAQASARAAGDSAKLKRLQEEMKMLKVRHSIALQYQQNVQKERSECPVFRVVNFPARQAVLVDSGSQTTLFSLLEPGRMVEMTIKEEIGKVPKTIIKNCISVAGESVSSQTPQSSSAAIVKAADIQLGVRAKHVVSVDSSGQIMAVLNNSDDPPAAKKPRLEETCDSHKNINASMEVSVDNSVTGNSDNFMVSAKQSESEKNLLQNNMQCDHNGLVPDSNDLLDNFLAPMQEFPLDDRPLDNCNSVVNANLRLTSSSCASLGLPDNSFVARPDMLRRLAYLDWVKCKKQDPSGNVPLHLAVMDEDINKVKRQCLVLSARKESIDIANFDDETPLHMAILNGNREIVSLLLRYGAQPSVRDGKGNTVLHLAVSRTSNYDCLEALLNRSRHINKIIDALNDDGYSALHLCALSGKALEIAALIYKGATVNLRDGKSGRTALFHATECNYPTVSRILLLNNASTTEPNFAGHTPLLVANELSWQDGLQSACDVINKVTHHAGEDLKMDTS